jgi:hypothetical protein
MQFAIDRVPGKWFEKEWDIVVPLALFCEDWTSADVEN